ncbi:hypothetical protein ACFPIJ_21865 [Dactylosporangium cerinum]|uniref:Uncharacterized protein n=1 Tax=Dactylosporangium cerinum TaxID=1434730 RepID=A0ABV9VYJ5_9ACTN
MNTSVDVVSLAAQALSDPDRAEQYVRNITEGLGERSLAMGPWNDARLVGVAASLAPLRLGRVLPPANRVRLIKRWRDDARPGGKIGVIVIAKILGIGVGTVSRDTQIPL